MDDINIYNNKRYNRMKNIFRIRLGLETIKLYPILCTLFIPIIVLTVLFWCNINFICKLVAIPEALFGVYALMIKLIGVILPFLFILAIVEAIGTLRARPDEASLKQAFDEKDVRNGLPILISKQKDSHSEVIILEFYSPVPFDIWIKRQDAIEDAMDMHLVEEIQYGRKNSRKRIRLYIVEGRLPSDRGPLYEDDEDAL